jgi:stalled ribosome rescue protein Dom34
MSQLHYAIVWIDHREAKVYRFACYDEPPLKVNSHNSLQRLHHRRGGWEAGGNPTEDHEFFGRIAGTLDQTAQILVTGPGDAKLAFKAYMDQLRPHDASQVMIVEMINHPGDEALYALGREHFHVEASPEPQKVAAEL